MSEAGIESLFRTNTPDEIVSKQKVSFSRKMDSIAATLRIYTLIIIPLIRAQNHDASKAPTLIKLPGSDLGFIF